MKVTDNCSCCGKRRKLLPGYNKKLCSTCMKYADLLSNDLPTATKLAETVGLSLYQPVNQQVDQDLPEVLDGVRYRTTDRERNTWYVSVSELKGNPVEVFASTAFDRDQHLQSRISNLTTITRLISLILRHIFMGEPLTLEKTLTQLKRSSRQPNDLPDMLGRILSNYSAESYDSKKEESIIP